MATLRQAYEDTLNDLKKVKEIAKEMDVMQRSCFLSTLDRYETQVKLVERLRKIVDDKKTEVLVTKEYVKGRENITINPVIQSYNQSVASANKTVVTLKDILKGFAEMRGEKPDDPLMEILGNIEG